MNFCHFVGALINEGGLQKHSYKQSSTTALAQEPKTIICDGNDSKTKGQSWKLLDREAWQAYELEQNSCYYSKKKIVTLYI